MITFKNVRYKNFLSTGNQFIDIQLDRAQSTLVVGENGAGKSTMLDALCFGLFQRPFRNIKKDQLVNSINEKECVVEVEFIIGQNYYKIIRGIKPNTFEIWCNDVMLNQDAAQRDYQKHLESTILKLNFRSFTQVVILGNASFVPFMQLRARHRRQVVEEILDIEIFSKMNLMFREKQKLQDEVIKQSDFNCQLIDGKIESQKKHIEELSGNNKQIIEKKKLDITKAETDITNYKIDIDKVELEKQDLQFKILDETKINNKYKQLHNVEAKLENTCSKHKKDLEFFKTHNDCPTCQQAIDEAFKSIMIDKKKNKVVEIESAMSQLVKEITDTEHRLNDINNTMVAIREKELLLNRYQTSIDEIKKYIDNLNNEQFESDWGSTNPNGIRSCYSEGKRLAESLCFDFARCHGTEIRIARIFNAYGPRMRKDDGRLISNLLYQALDGENLSVFGSGEQSRSLCYIDDLVQGIIKLMNSNYQYPINLGNPNENYSILQIANLIKNKFNNKSKITFHPLPKDDPFMRKPSIKLARNILNWEPKINIQEGIDTTSRYIKGKMK